MDSQLELSLQERRARALGVTELVRLVRDSLELNLDEYWVVGEISNSRIAPSNHLYFTLKDSRSSIAVVMFRTANQRLRFKVSDGMAVMVRGRVNLYEARGSLQFYAEEIEPRGAGALQLAFEQLKERLGALGMFAAERKRPIPFLPRAIGIVTALGGAALRDLLSTIHGRFPNVRVIVRPAKVQGEGAGYEVAEALDDLNRHGMVDCIIVGRGGGSLEDLWAFNEEIVARAIHRSRIPVISAVGHEIDYTISDFVADLRAPTPTAAGQIVVPNKADLKRRLNDLQLTLISALRGTIAAERRHLRALSSRLRDPAYLMRQARQRTDECSNALRMALTRMAEHRRRQLQMLAGRIKPPRGALRERRAGLESASRHLLHSATAMLGDRRQRLVSVGARLDSLSPLKVLGRGYSVVVNIRDGRAVTDAMSVEVGDTLDVRLHRGRVQARAFSRRT